MDEVVSSSIGHTKLFGCVMFFTILVMMVVFASTTERTVNDPDDIYNLKRGLKRTKKDRMIGKIYPEKDDISFMINIDPNILDQSSAIPRELFRNNNSAVITKKIFEHPENGGRNSPCRINIVTPFPIKLTGVLFAGHNVNCLPYEFSVISEGVCIGKSIGEPKFEHEFIRRVNCTAKYMSFTIDVKSLNASLNTDSTETQLQLTKLRLVGVK